MHGGLNEGKQNVLAKMGTTMRVIPGLRMPHTAPACQVVYSPNLDDWLVQQRDADPADPLCDSGDDINDSDLVTGTLRSAEDERSHGVSYGDSDHSSLRRPPPAAVAAAIAAALGVKAVKHTQLNRRSLSPPQMAGAAGISLRWQQRCGNSARTSSQSPQLVWGRSQTAEELAPNNRKPASPAPVPRSLTRASPVKRRSNPSRMRHIRPGRRTNDDDAMEAILGMWDSGSVGPCSELAAKLSTTVRPSSAGPQRRNLLEAIKSAPTQQAVTRPRPSSKHPAHTKTTPSPVFASQAVYNADVRPWPGAEKLASGRNLSHSHSATHYLYSPLGTLRGSPTSPSHGAGVVVEAAGRIKSRGASPHQLSPAVLPQSSQSSDIARKTPGGLGPSRSATSAAVADWLTNPLASWLAFSLAAPDCSDSDGGAERAFALGRDPSLVDLPQSPMACEGLAFTGRDGGRDGGAAEDWGAVTQEAVAKGMSTVRGGTATVADAMTVAVSGPEARAVGTVALQDPTKVAVAAASGPHPGHDHVRMGTLAEAAPALPLSNISTVGSGVAGCIGATTSLSSAVGKEGEEAGALPCQSEPLPSPAGEPHHSMLSVLCLGDDSSSANVVRQLVALVKSQQEQIKGLQDTVAALSIGVNSAENMGGTSAAAVTYESPGSCTMKSPDKPAASAAQTAAFLPYLHGAWMGKQPVSDAKGAAGGDGALDEATAEHSARGLARAAAVQLYGTQLPPSQHSSSTHFHDSVLSLRTSGEVPLTDGCGGGDIATAQIRDINGVGDPSADMYTETSGRVAAGAVADQVLVDGWWISYGRISGAATATDGKQNPGAVAAATWDGAFAASAPLPSAPQLLTRSDDNLRRPTPSPHVGAAQSLDDAIGAFAAAPAEQQHDEAAAAMVLSVLNGAKWSAGIAEGAAVAVASHSHYMVPELEESSGGRGAGTYGSGVVRDCPSVRQGGAVDTWVAGNPPEGVQWQSDARSPTHHEDALPLIQDIKELRLRLAQLEANFAVTSIAHQRSQQAHPAATGQQQEQCSGSPKQRKGEGRKLQWSPDKQKVAHGILTNLECDADSRPRDQEQREQERERRLYAVSQEVLGLQQELREHEAVSWDVLDQLANGIENVAACVTTVLSPKGELNDVTAAAMLHDSPCELYTQSRVGREAVGARNAATAEHAPSSGRMLAVPSADDAYGTLLVLQSEMRRVRAVMVAKAMLAAAVGIGKGSGCVNGKAGCCDSMTRQQQQQLGSATALTAAATASPRFDMAAGAAIVTAAGADAVEEQTGAVPACVPPSPGGVGGQEHFRLQQLQMQQLQKEVSELRNSEALMVEAQEALVDLVYDMRRELDGLRVSLPYSISGGSVAHERDQSSGMQLAPHAGRTRNDGATVTTVAVVAASAGEGTDAREVAAERRTAVAAGSGPPVPNQVCSERLLSVPLLSDPGQLCQQPRQAVGPQQPKPHSQQQQQQRTDSLYSEQLSEMVAAIQSVNAMISGSLAQALARIQAQGDEIEELKHCVARAIPEPQQQQQQ